MIATPLFKSAPLSPLTLVAGCWKEAKSEAGIMDLLEGAVAKGVDMKPCVSSKERTSTSRVSSMAVPLSPSDMANMGSSLDVVSCICSKRGLPFSAKDCDIGTARNKSEELHMINPDSLVEMHDNHEEEGRQSVVSGEQAKGESSRCEKE